MKEYYSFKIPEPCHEDWNQMTPSARGRFCTSCEKTVIDFTDMNTFEIGNYLKENLHNGVCGHINKSQLDRVVLKVPVSTIHQLRFSSRFFAIALLVVMGTTLMSCKDQYGNKKKIDSVEIVDSLETNQMLLGVMAPPKSLMDSISQNELKKADCDANAIKYRDSIDQEIPITGGFGAPPVPPVIDVATTGEIVTVEGAMVLEDRYSNEVPFALVQNPPQFPNTPRGMKRNEGKKYFSDLMNQHISTNFNEKVLDTTILGRHRIVTQFKIDTNGQIIDIKVKAKYKVLEAEVLRVLESLPQLVPGKDGDNNKVAVTYVLPIIFENKVPYLDHVIKSFPKVIKDIPFLIVDKTPRFVDSPKDISEIENKKLFVNRVDKHVNDNFNKEIVDFNVVSTYKVEAQFIIDANGLITEIMAIAEHPELEAELQRVIEMLPHFIPGEQNSEKVRVLYALRFRFEKN